MDPGHGRNEGGDSDRLLQDYDSVIRESSLLTTFTGILFGFLLTISMSHVSDFSLLERILVLVAIFSTTIAISLFVLPVIYHHLQYPYRDLEKFKLRAHRFMLFGFVPTAVTLYLCLELALASLTGWFGFLLAALPFALVYALFKMRK